MDPFLGEIRLMPWDWPPEGWAKCDGTTLSVQQNQALYALIGNAFGGSAPTTFKLPDLRGRTPICWGQGPDGHVYTCGEAAGAEAIALDLNKMPAHTHACGASTTPANQGVPDSGIPATVAVQSGAPLPIYGPPNLGSLVPIQATTVGTAGASQSHNNMQPFLVLNFCIATMGIWPPRN